MEAPIDFSREYSDRLALEALNADFVFFLDQGEIDSLVDLFCDDALYVHGQRRSLGRDAIAALFLARASQQQRTSRHIYSGLRLNFDAGDTASGTSVCLTFAADGPPPLPANPILVADFIDAYRRCEDGNWRFQSTLR